jgi:hypothetical protein
MTGGILEGSCQENKTQTAAYDAARWQLSNKKEKNKKAFW